MDLDQKMPIKLNLLEQAQSNSRGNLVNVGNSIKQEIIQEESTPKKRRGRPKKSDKEETKIAEAKDNAVITVDSSIVPFTIVNRPTDPVINQYREVTGLLRHSISQLDELASDAKSALDQVKASRTVQGKYRNISELTQSISGIISSKLNAINQMKSIITDSNNMELKRAKDFAEANKNETNSDQQIIQMYQKLMQMPTSMEAQLGVQPLTQAMFNPGNIVVTQDQVDMLQAPPMMQNVTPEMQRMMLEGNENIRTVVRYDPSTTIREFDVIDVTTGESIPGVAKPSQMELDGMQISEKEGVAYNSDLNTQYELVMDPSIANKF